MKHQILAPNVGESITEVSILKWAKQDGQQVMAGEPLLEIESDKATVEIVSEFSGALTILKPPGERLPVGVQIGLIDDAVTGTVATKITTAVTNVPAANHSGHPSTSAHLSPSVRKAVTEQKLDAAQIPGTGKDGRITKGDVLTYSSTGSAASPAAGTTNKAPSAQQPTNQPASVSRPGERRVPMSMLRARIAERLVQAQQTAAILTTFNEVDMGPIQQLRNQHKDAFKATHGISLSFMSFFTRAVVESLKLIPEVNASIDLQNGARDIVYHDYMDIGIAVGTDRGLVVPVIRGAEKMGLLEIEKIIAALAIKARDGKLSIPELSGGTFTISNGGVYGSLLSTPILNPPQSGILGMHKIQDRPVAVDGKVEIRPMMYLALSYDHRLIDGKGAVTFLVTLKSFLEHPEKLKLSF